MGLPGGLSLLKSLLSGRKWATWCAATPLLGDPGAARSRQSAMEIELFASAVSRHELHGVPWCSFLLFSTASTPPSTHRIKERERPTLGARRAGGVQRPGDWRDECRQGAGVPSSREDGAGKSNCVCPGPLPSFYLSLSLFSHVRTADGVASRRRCPCAAQALVRAARSASAPGAPAPSLSRAVRMCDHDTRRLHAAAHQFRPVPCVGVTPPWKGAPCGPEQAGRTCLPGAWQHRKHAAEAVVFFASAAIRSSPPQREELGRDSRLRRPPSPTACAPEPCTCSGYPGGTPACIRRARQDLCSHAARRTSDHPPLARRGRRPRRQLPPPYSLHARGSTRKPCRGLVREGCPAAAMAR